jgi:hypothetical protein
MTHQRLIDTLDLFDHSDDSSSMAVSSVANDMWKNDERVVREKALVLYKKACNVAALRVHQRKIIAEKEAKARSSLINELTLGTPKTLFAGAVREALATEREKGKGKGKKGKGKGAGKHDSIRPPPGLSVDWHGIATSSSTRPADYNDPANIEAARIATSSYVFNRPNGMRPGKAGKTAVKWHATRQQGPAKGSGKNSGKDKGKGKNKGSGKDKGKGKGKGQEKGKGKDPTLSGKGKGKQPKGKGRGRGRSGRGRGGRGRSNGSNAQAW